MSGAIPLSAIRTSVTSQFLAEDREDTPVGNVEDLFPASTSFDHGGDAIELIRPPWKRDLYELLEQPTSSPSAFLVHVLTTSLIVVSALVTVMETVPAFHHISGGLWFGLETSLVALFTVEYIARCTARTYTLRAFVGWITSFFGIIDLLAILPYYIEIALRQDTSVLFRFSILRTFRLVRVFRPFRYNNTLLLTIEVMYLSFRRSQHALLALSFFVLMVLTVFSTLLYFAERGTWDETLETFIDVDGDPSQFSSIPAAAWFVLVTITTVGYGEITPRSFLGRLITLPLLLFGLLLIALPSFVLGREFSIVWAKMTKNQNINEPLVSASVANFHDLQNPAQSDISRDLSNRKLAQNQAELSRQITELRTALQMQGETLRTLLEIMESEKGRMRPNGAMHIS
ncbi:voltage-gated potassium channel [Gloeophyllum trabeum ATCC 11539]|uniref:Voltage-gated potassium channel n=1 Tax=Gloeophyllum trabeum (strain ATCC 11539 / FP-39264 / Madison 617) TaxID=670483 RepID=S7Q4K1_GLOTA|nr:voltage-gated potassium channel [Gloeophyllum trabeum ATCC 11539]EPQ54408.1 voltage-gated potassium channel [Gloeophyllum trabeum ATCC 11539]